MTCQRQCWLVPWNKAVCHVSGVDAQFSRQELLNSHLISHLWGNRGEHWEEKERSSWIVLCWACQIGVQEKVPLPWPGKVQAKGISV